MAGNVALDIVNTDPKAFFYPVYILSGNNQGDIAHSPFESILNYWPRTIGYKLPTGHYLLFESIGVLLIILVFWQMKKGST